MDAMFWHNFFIPNDIQKNIRFNLLRKKSIIYNLLKYKKGDYNSLWESILNIPRIYIIS
jgi:hypothetical protein